MIQRHESLRTGFVYKGGEPVQVVHDDVHFGIEALPAAQPEGAGGRDEITPDEISAAGTAAAGAFVRPFDLGHPPLLRVGLTPVTDDTHILLFDIHHIISDGSSVNILIEQFMRAYAGETLPGQVYQYKDFSQWQNRGLEMGALEQQAAFWLERFSGTLPVLDLPLDFPRPPVRSFAGDRIEVYLDAALRENIGALARETGATLFMILAAALGLLLGRYAGIDDIIIGSPIAGRHHKDLNGVFGLFVEMIALRIFPRGDKPFDGYLKEVKDITLKAYDNQEYPFGELKKIILPEDDMSRNPLFDVMLIVQNQGRLKLEMDELAIAPLQVENKTSKLDLNLEVYEEEQGIRIELEYCSALFRRGAIERFYRHLTRVLTEAVAHPAILSSDIDIMSEAERRRVLIEFNDTAADYPGDVPVHELFEQQVEHGGDRTAVRGAVHAHTPLAAEYGGPVSLTYSQLNRLADRVAAVLSSRGVSGGTIVGILAERSVETVAALLGILKAGGAYLPIDADAPADRVAFLCTESNIPLLLTTRALAETIAPSCPCLFLEDILLSPGGDGDRETQDSAVTPAAAETNPGSPAYVLYTSGSTGTPKGVVVEHRGVVNILHWFKETFAVGNGTQLLQLTDYTFDPSVEDMFATLGFGGTLHLADKELVLNRERFREYVDRQAIEIVNFVPTMLVKLLCPGGKLESLRVVISGGERLEEAVKDAILERGYGLYNNYGPTEITVDALSGLCGGVGNRVTIGKPVANTACYILDRGGLPVPVGIAGELCIAGAGVARGYLNNPELTARQFSHHAQLKTPLEVPPSRGSRGRRPLALPAQGPPEGRRRQSLRLYHTGDLARWLADGNVRFMGRVDRQVKIRGYRVELGEIENRLLKHPLIGETVVTAVERPAMGKVLCAYFVPEAAEEVTVRELREYLGQRLPDYMVPAYFIPLEAIPLTANGKVDKSKLPPPSGEIDTGVEYIAPAGDTERRLAAIWREVLALEQVGVKDNFFESGGNSIIMIQSMVRIREELDRDVSLKTFFQNPTIEKLSTALEGEAGQADDERAIGRAPRGGVLPLSFPQERIWFLEHLYDDYTSYYVPRAIRIKGEVDREMMRRVFSEIIRRHEILRTAFPEIDGKPAQVIKEPFFLDMPIVDMTDMAGAHREEAVKSFIRAQGQKKFDLVEGPMIRSHLLKLSSREHILVLCEHHLVHDGWTQNVLLKEFVTIYKAFCEGKPSPFPELPIQYADYAVWQRNYFQGDVMERQLEYWKEKLEGLPPLLEIPADRPRPPVMSGNGRENLYRVPVRLSRQMEGFGNETGVTLFMTMLAGFKAMMSRYTGARDLCIGTGVAGRHHKETEDLLGMIINTLALRTPVTPDITFGECVARVKTTCLDAYQYDETPLEKVVEVLRPERSLSYTPLFQVLFSFMDVPTHEFALPGLELSHVIAHNRTSKFDLNIISVPADPRDPEAEMMTDWEFNTDIFDSVTIDRMVDHYLRLLDAATANPDLKIHELPLAGEEELEQLLHTFNDTAAEYPRDRTLQDVFSGRAERSRDAVALAGPNGCSSSMSVPPVGTGALSYGELDRKTASAAAFLRGKGVGPGSMVGIKMGRSVEMMVAVLAVLKTGGAYLPIDPAYPDERIRYMLADSNARLLVMDAADEPGSGGGAEMGIEVIDWRDLTAYNGAPRMESGAGNGAAAPVEHPAAGTAYVIYTSGSTGKPKGVMIGHSALLNFIKGIRDIVPFKVGDAILSLTTICFDIFGLETHLPLTAGSRVVIGSGTEQMDPRAAGVAMARESINMLQVTPSRLQLLLSDEGAVNELSGLDYLLLGGEALPLKVLEEARRLNPGKIYNLYGPTETTIWSTVKEVGGDRALNIGKPIANTRVYILDSLGNVQPTGVAGELFIGGDGLAGGYINKPELTAERFVNYKIPRIGDAGPNLKGSQDKNFLEAGSRVYRTGDLARWLAGGNIEFLGRIDFQVKVRGYRIELEEIESRLTGYGPVKEAVAIAMEPATGGTYICAYYTAGGGEDDGDDGGEPLQRIDVTELRTFLHLTLPDYMIPSYFVEIENIPLTPNGKVDRKALPKPGKEAVADYTAPRTAREHRLVEIWSEVIGIDKDQLGIDANFFEVGGHSLNATLVVARIHREFNVHIPLTAVFKWPTIRGLERIIGESRRDTFRHIEAVEKKEYYPLSSAQKRMYLLQRMAPQSTAYNLSWIFPVPAAAPVSLETIISKLESAYNKLIHRHESLRTSFHLIDAAVQVIHPTADFKIEPIHLQAPSSHNLREAKHFFRPFDLSCAPLLRVGVVCVENHPASLLVDMHHIITDGTSQGILAREMGALLAGEPLTPLTLRYRDYACWQNSPGQKEAIQRQKQFWLNLFPDEPPVLELPLDYPRPLTQTFEGSTFSFALNKTGTRGLMETARQNQATLYMTMLSVFTLLLAKLGRAQDVTVGMPSAGRLHAQLQELVGMFVNTLAMRNYPQATKSFLQFLREVKENTLKVFENQEYPFEDLVDTLAVRRDTGRNPLFDTMFNLLNQSHNTAAPVSPRDEEPGDLAGTSRFDLTLTAFEAGEELFCSFEYRTKLFKRETIKRFAAYLKRIVHVIAGAPYRLLGDIEIITPEEREQILYRFNQPPAPGAPGRPIHRLFQDQAHKTPHHVCTVGPVSSVQFTYAEIDRLSTGLAARLQRGGVTPGTIVAVMAAPSIHRIIGLWAILKAGGAYLPIAPDCPEERLHYILGDSNAPVLLMDSLSPQPLEHLEHRIEIIDIRTTPSDHRSMSPLDPPSRPSHSPAYIIFTSGTTGRPKGVVVNHNGLVNYTNYRLDKYRYSTRDVTLQLLSYSFDGFASNFYSPMLSGGKLVFLAPEIAADYRGIVSLVNKTGVTNTCLVPTMYRLLLDGAGEKPFSGLRFIVLAGEAADAALVERSKRLHPSVRLINEYGPTEGTVACAVNTSLSEDAVTVIGRPITNTAVYILSGFLKLQPIGVAGELCIAGAGIARGYLNQPELTDANFVCSVVSSQSSVVSKKQGGEAPLVGGPGGARHGRVLLTPWSAGRPPEGTRYQGRRGQSLRLYRTGDLGRWLPDGNIQFLGRLDTQVKIRGFRIELGEIENRLLKHPRVKDAALLTREDRSREKFLCAYIVVSTPGEPGNQQVPSFRDYLSRFLPDYMVPAHFIVVPEIPLTPNGKRDLKKLGTYALPEVSGARYVEPSGHNEKAVAEVWREVLQRENISNHDNFFEIGGDSLKAILVLSKLQVHFDITFNDIFAHQTLGSLAHAIEYKSDGDKVRATIEDIKRGLQAPAGEDSDKFAQMEKRNEEAMEAYRKKYRAGMQRDLSLVTPYENILLTGATGYLGIHLLERLLETTGAHIHVLVRAQTVQAAEERLQDKFRWYFKRTLFPAYRERVSVVPGDIAADYFGLGPAPYRRLAQSVDCIINSAANVKHYGIRGDFESVNVEGVKRLLDFAGDRRPKDFNQVSTTSIAEAVKSDDWYNLFSEYKYPSLDDYRERSHYIETKVQAETLLLEARAAGMNANIMRVGNLICHSQTGGFQENIADNAFYVMMQAFLKLGLFPDMDVQMLEFSFIDVVARAVALLFSRRAFKNETYHVRNPHHLNYPEFAELVNQLPYGAERPLRVVSVMEFLDFLKDNYHNEAFAPYISPLLLHSGLLQERGDVIVDFTSEKTEAFLDKLGLQWPHPGAKHIEKLLQHGQERNFF